MNTHALQAARFTFDALAPAERAAFLAEKATAAPDRIITRRETAERFRKTERTIDVWAARGVLHKVKIPGSSRSAGFRLSEVESLLRGDVSR